MIVVVVIGSSSSIVVVVVVVYSDTVLHYAHAASCGEGGASVRLLFKTQPRLMRVL